MKHYQKKTFSLGLCALCFILAQSNLAQSPPNVSFAYNRFYNYDEVIDILKKMEKKYPQFLNLQSVGKSIQNRDMWVMTINNPKTGNEMDKAAMYIDGDIHGNEVQGTEAILYTIDYLMTNYGVVDKVTQLVDERVFYLVPMVNPDGRAHWFDKKNFGGGGRGGMKPMDDDNDGLFDEDGYDDIDGDGLILQMRKKVKFGDYRLSKEDPRLMERVPTGEFGDYENLGTEGIDNDGDGRINEDGPTGYDMNRNWPTDWQPPYVQYGASDYPFSNPETRAVGQFILSHPNIAGVQAYHNSGGMILRGPGDKSQGTYPMGDQRVYDFIGKRGEEILPFYRYMILWKDLYTVHGGFVNWTAEGLGIFSFSNELWSSNQYYNKPSAPRGEDEDRFAARAREQAERLKFDDYVEMGARYVEWKPFTHPTYGEIELGGWVRETGRVPPLFMLEELCHRNAAFTLFHADQMPLVQIDTVEVEKLSDRSYKIWVTVLNKRAMPTISQIAVKNRTNRPDIITVQGKQIEVVSAGIVTDRWMKRINLVDERPERVLLPNGIPGNGTRTVQFILSGSGNVEIALDCMKGGKDRYEMNLK
ncbi:MAG: M14 family metallopeptidase [bacterium]